jgi:signal peptidase I
MNTEPKKSLPSFAALPTIIVLAFVFLASGFSQNAEAANSAKFYKSQLYGYSMYPTIKSGEYIFYKTADVAEVSEGDIVVFTDRKTGERVCHRVTAIMDGKLKTKGDNNRFSDRGFISNQNLLGVVTHVNGKSV